MTEKRESYLGETPGPALVVLDALCHGSMAGRECGNDLSAFAVAACRGEPRTSVVILCPLCLHQVTVELRWQPALVCYRPEVRGE